MLNENLKLELKVRDQVTQLHIFRSLKPAYHLSTGPKYDAHSLALDVSHPRYRYPESELRCISRPMIQHILAQNVWVSVRCLKRPVNKGLYIKPSMTWASMRTWPKYNTDDRSEHVLCRIIIHSPQLERSLTRYSSVFGWSSRANDNICTNSQTTIAKMPPGLCEEEWKKSISLNFA